MFNFFWTSFTYLPVFFFVVVLTLLLFFNKLPVILIFTLYTYTFEVSDFLVLNLNTANFNLNVTDFNLLLVNNLNKYHPFIFYLSAISLLITVFLLNKSFIKHDSMFLWGSSIRLTLICFKRSLIINSFALFLGSYWALQEGTWGGWWDWDPSEVFGLLFFITNIFFIHSALIQTYFFKIILKLLLAINIILLSYFLIQLNFDLVSHNFGTKFFYFFNNNFFLLEFVSVIICNILATLLWSNRLISSLNNIILNNKLRYSNTVTNYLRTLVPLLIIVLVIFSFIPLINYFIWYDVTTNYYDLVVYFNIILINLLMILLSFFRFKQLYNYVMLVLITFTLFNSFLNVLPLLFRYIYMRTTLIHISVLLLSSVNLMTHYLEITVLNFSSETEYFINSSNAIIFNSSFFSCDNFFIENNHTFNDSLGSVFTEWLMYYLSNSTNNQPILLIFNTDNFFNLYTTLFNWFFLYSFIEINYLSNLYTSLIIVIFTAWYFYIKNCSVHVNY